MKPGELRSAAGPPEEVPNVSVSVLDRVNSCVLIIDLAGKITYWNKRAEEVRGWKREELIGRSFLDIVPPELRALADKELRGTAWSAPWSREVEALRKDGTSIPMLMTAAALKDSDGRVTGTIHVSVDITERKQMEKRLRDSEEKFRGIAERSFDGIFILDSGGNTTYASPSLFKLTGFNPEEVEGLPLLKFIPESSISKVVEAMGKVFEGQTINNFEVEGRRKDGSKVLLEVNAAPVFDVKHSVTAIQGIARDVTERRSAEEYGRLLALIVESAPMGMLRLDMDGIIRAWNPAAERIYGYSSKEVIGQPYSFLAPRDRVAEQTLAIERLKKGGGIIHLNTKRKKKDGSLFDSSLDSFPIKDRFGAVVGYSGFFNDVTAQKAAEGKIRSLQETRLKLVSAATHELKTPLVSIKGYSDLAASGSLGELSEPLEHGLAVIGRNVERMLILIKELLDIERMDSDQLQLSKEVVDLKEVIMESVDNLRPIMNDKKLEMVVVLPEVPPYVVGDRIRLHEVMDNLLVNAVKFTPEKGRIRVVAAEEAGQVRISVDDSGIGISPDNLPNLFEPFSKIPKSGSVENQEIYGLYSTGLGLAVTKRLVELHGGRVWAESGGEGKGSTFVFTIPSASQRSRSE